MSGRYKDPWRLILDPPAEGPVNMAVDEAILLSTVRGEAPPAFRLYAWKSPTVSIGCLQDPGPLVSAGLPIVRRITGGRAVLHHREITYSIVCSSGDPLYQRGISGAYLLISRAVAAALEEVGLDVSLARSRPVRRALKSEACFRSASRYEVLLGGRKVVGSAQRRFKTGFLQHGSILLDIDRAMTEKLFGADALSSMASVADHLASFDEGELKDALIRTMARELQASFLQTSLTADEARLRDALMEKKYSNTCWNLSGEKAVLEHSLT